MHRFLRQIRKLSRRRRGRVRLWAAIDIVVLLSIWSFTGLHVVDETQRGVVLRLGAYEATLSPGLHWRAPWPIETVERVATTEVNVLEYERSMLTADENIVSVGLTVHYRRSDPRAYLFNVRDPETVLRNAAESAIREVAGTSPLDFILTRGRAAIDDRTQALMQDMLDDHGAGILVEDVNLVRANFPAPVESAVQETLRAQQDKVRQRLEGEAYANGLIPRARGAAARRLERAKAYKARVVAAAAGEADRFLQVLRAYERAPGVTRQRLYLETMEDVFSRSSKVLLDVDNARTVIGLPLEPSLEGRRGTIRD